MVVGALVYWSYGLCYIKIQYMLRLSLGLQLGWG